MHAPLRHALALALLLPAGEALAYTATANVTFNWATEGTARVWIGTLANSLAGMANSTYFSGQGGFNAVTYYNPDFVRPDEFAALGCPPGTETFHAQYACKIGAVKPIGVGGGDAGPGPAASGTLLVTATTLTGTLTVINTNDEGAGPQPGTTAATGHNIRFGDGSPFKNVWYGVSSSATLTVALTGTFTPTAWSITGGTVAMADPGFQCAVADFSGVLCTPSSLGGGFQADGSGLGLGMSQGNGPGTGTTEIQVFDATGTTLLTSLSGVLAQLVVDGGGNLTTLAGEVRRGAGNDTRGCLTSLRYNGSGISCGTLQVGRLAISGSVVAVPVPAAAWLFASAAGLLALARRRR
jgi:hypothetical protein